MINYWLHSDASIIIIKIINVKYKMLMYHQWHQCSHTDKVIKYFLHSCIFKKYTALCKWMCLYVFFKKPHIVRTHVQCQVTAKTFKHRHPWICVQEKWEVRGEMIFHLVFRFSSAPFYRGSNQSASY